MKIEMTQSHYADASGFKLVGAGEHEVDDERGRYLVETFPSWFSAVDGESSAPTGEDENEPSDSNEPETGDQENDAPEAPQDESEPSQPTKSLSKMNKDELVALAGELGVEVTDEMTNDELRTAIKVHQEV